MRKYFSNPFYKDALTSYAKVAEERDWGIDHKLELYNWAKVAFDPSPPEGKRREAFYVIYNNLKRYWKVFRNAQAGYWSADETFEGLNKACKGCTRQDPLTLISLKYLSPESEVILVALNKLRDLKPAREYPWMPVAKFTHFFNPILFPIYDYEIIWKKVMNRAFRKDYRDFCFRHDLNPNGPAERFNLNYMLWAGYNLQQADSNFMNYFVDWFKSQTANQPDDQNVLDDLPNYYATAFEFVAIGAAEIELANNLTQ